MAMVSACGSHPYAPAYPTDDSFFSEPQPVQLAGVPEDPAPPRVLMPGDVVNVQVISAETTTYEELVVDGTGNIHLPLIGEVEIGGRTLSEAEAAVKEAMKRYDKLAEAAVILTRPEGHVVTVLGAVPERGRLPLPPGARLADVLALAGGPLMSEAEGPLALLSDLEGARLYRQGEALPVSFVKAMEGDPKHNIHVHPGDHVYVPPLRGNTVSILGQVGSPRVVEFRSGLRLTEALALAGGTTREADGNDIRIVRGTLAAPRVYETSVKDLIAGKGHDVQLASGDVVYVTEHWSAGFTEVVSAITPILAVAASFALVYMTIETQRTVRRSLEAD